MKTVEEFSNAISEFLNAENERAAVIFAFSLLEQFIGDLLTLKSKHPRSYKNMSVSMKMKLLHELNAITDHEYESIEWLRKQRNKSSHTRNYSPPSKFPANAI